MRDGKTLRDVYQFVVEYVREQKPDLEKHFAKNLSQVYVYIVHCCARSGEVDRVVDRYQVQGRGVCPLA